YSCLKSRSPVLEVLWYRRRVCRRNAASGHWARSNGQIPSLSPLTWREVITFLSAAISKLKRSHTNGRRTARWQPVVTIASQRSPCLDQGWRSSWLNIRGEMATRVRSLAAIAAVLAPTGAGPGPRPTPPSAEPAATTPIRHLVVIWQENISFDHYFGTYPHAANVDGTPFTAKPDTPAIDGLTPDLLTHNPNSVQPMRLGGPGQ